MDRQRVREIVASWVTLRTDFTKFQLKDMNGFIRAMNDRTRQLIAEFQSEHGSLDPMFWQNLSRGSELAQKALDGELSPTTTDPFDVVQARKVIKDWDTVDSLWFSGLTELSVHAATLTAGARVIADGVDRTNL